jgi:hypothetical protein
MWGERIWPTEKQKQLTKAERCNLQEQPLSVDDILEAVREHGVIVTNQRQRERLITGFA